MHCRYSKAYKREKLCNFHIKDLPFAFRGICLLRERHLYLLKVIFFKIYRILPLRSKNVSDLEGILNIHIVINVWYFIYLFCIHFVYILTFIIHHGLGRQYMQLLFTATDTTIVFQIDIKNI